MLPPFRMGLPIKLGSSSKVGRGMERVTEWVYDHPARVVARPGRDRCSRWPSGWAAWLTSRTYINAFKPQTRVVRDYATVESRLGGIGVVEVLVPTSGPIDPATLEKFRSVERGLLEAKSGRPKASLRPLAGDGPRPRPADRSAAGGVGRQSPGDQARPDRGLASGGAAAGLPQPRGEAGADPRPAGRAAAGA